MSLRYRTERARNGMVVDPSPLNLNNNEFAGEFGGYLQRDNTPIDAITGDMVEQGAFTDLLYDPRDDVLALDISSQEWQVQVGGTDINSVSFTADVDCVLLIRWSGGHRWDSGAYTGEAVRYHITVNGVEVCASGPMERSNVWHGTSLNGTIAVQAGPVDVKLGAMVARFNTAIRSPGIFSILSGIETPIDIAERELIVMVRSR